MINVKFNTIENELNEIPFVEITSKGLKYEKDFYTQMNDYKGYKSTIKSIENDLNDLRNEIISFDNEIGLYGRVHNPNYHDIPNVNGLFDRLIYYLNESIEAYYHTSFMCIDYLGHSYKQFKFIKDCFYNMDS